MKDIKKNNNKVKGFYKKATEIYYKQTGGYINGYATPEGFLSNYIIENFINEGDYVLDAGCGMGKLSVEMAQKCNNTYYKGVTISDIQVEIANKLVKEFGVENKVEIFKGDFHYLDKIFEDSTFDVIIFNESLFHSVRPDIVLNSAYKVLKKGGVLYAKDIYKNESTKNVFRNIKMRRVVSMIKENYTYHCQNVCNIREMFLDIGFKEKSFLEPKYPADFNTMINFEKMYGIETYKYIQQTNATHWRELILCK